MENRFEDLGRFNEIREEIASLADEALNLYAKYGNYERGKGYWYAHLMGAIGGHYNTFLGGSFIDMESAAEEIEGEI